MKTRFFLISLLSVVMLLTYSCRDRRTDNKALVSNAQDEAEANTFFDDIFNEMDKTLSELESNNYEPNNPKSINDQGTRVITVTQGQGSSQYPNFPRLITIEYTNWTSPSGKVKNGIVRIHITAPHRVVGSIKTITFENFFIDSHQIEGTKTVENIGERSFTITVSDGKITFPDSTTYTRNASRTRVWQEGYETPFNISDDEFDITGSATGVNRQGKAYTHTIGIPLRIRIGCPWIVSGTLTLEVGDATGLLDYGNGECDNQATLTINDNTYTITLRGKRF